MNPNDFKRAKYRVIGKNFKKSIAIGTCANLPDDIIDSIPDEDIKLFKECLYAVGLVQIKSPTYLYGKWESSYTIDKDYHFTLEEIIS